ncbi:hypothetical protein MBLNU230_g5950t1 [Neophaeotheca triangularis]
MKFTNQRPFHTADFSISQDSKLVAIAAEVQRNPENADAWGPLLEAVEAQDGGISRNSTPEAITLFRETYDELLARFPLYFGYWRKYASTEFTIGGTDTAEMIYERGVACCPHVLGLWDGYITFKLESCHDDDQIRELFERAVEDVGLDFQASDIWDKYLAFESNANDSKARYVQLLLRIIRLPIRAADKYASTLLQLAQTMPIQEIATPEHFFEVHNGVQQEATRNPGLNVDQTTRDVIVNTHRQTIERTKHEVSKRIPHEDALAQTQNYFLPMKRSESDVMAWEEYLGFEEVNGSYESCKMLYERALVVLAYHQDLWFRYARWMLAQQGDKAQEVRNIFQRASQIFVPIAEPAVRLQYAYFEETQSNIDYALDIIKAVLDQLPDDLEVIIAHVNITRRQLGVDAAISVCKQHIENPGCLPDTKGAVLVEAARLVGKVKGNILEARSLFESHKQEYSNCAPFWDGYASFELDQNANGTDSRKYERVKSVFDDILHLTQISPDYTKQAFGRYFQYLQNYGTKDAMKEYLKVDALINGSRVVSMAMAAEIGAGTPQGNGKQSQATNNNPGNQNGGHQVGR